MLQRLSVAELNGYVKAVLESDQLLADVWVAGEVSNCKRHSSGHWYLTLKDDTDALDAVCFRSSAARLTTLPANGMAVLAHGYVSVYGSRVQLYIDMLRPAGEGLLQAQFERLRSHLEAEGLFGRKRALPLFPRRIGVVTSPTGAAFRDVLHVLQRRFPLAEVLLSPALVQGALAAESLVEALYALYDHEPDVILLCRGGGSLEDLWCFNEEIVARALFASPVPTITGVGHETDTTMVDYVADMRAPTPSAAAEQMTPSIALLSDEVHAAREALTLAFMQHSYALRARLATHQQRLERVSPLQRLHTQRQQLDHILERTTLRLQQGLRVRRLQLEALQRSLDALNPLATLQRGYAVVSTAQGTVVHDPAQVAPADVIQVQLRTGTIHARVIDPSTNE